MRLAPIPRIAILALSLLLSAGAAQAAPAKLHFLVKGDGVFSCELPACTTVTEVVDDDTADRALRLDPVGGWIYYVGTDQTFFTPNIIRTALDGSGSQVLYVALGIGGVSINDFAIAPDGSGVYYSATGGPWRIRKIELPSGTLTDVLSFLEGGVNQLPYHLDFDTGVAPALLHWRIAHAPFQIWRANPVPDPITSSSIVFGDPNLDQAFRLDVADRRVYYALAGTITRAELPDFTNPETVAAAGGGFSFGIALDLDARMVYWSDSFTSEILRAPMDPPFGAPQVVATATGGTGVGGVDILPGTTPQVPSLGWIAACFLAVLLAATGFVLIPRVAVAPRC